MKTKNIPIGTPVIINNPLYITHGKEGVVAEHYEKNSTSDNLRVSFDDEWEGYYHPLDLIINTELGRAIYKD